MSDEITDTKTASARAFDYDRTVALSDGVFAIALTLLVLTISFPELHGTDARLDSWCRYAVAPIVLLISIPIALFVSPTAAEYSCLLLLLTGPVEGRLSQRTS